MYQDFAKIYDDAMDNIPYESWCQDIRGELNRQGIDTGTICELGCGTGTMTELLAGYGYDMIGVDLSEEMLAEAMSKIHECQGQVQYVHQDMRELTLHRPVEAVISICDSINYLLEIEDLIQTFTQVRRYLKPDGIFLFDMKTEYCYQTVMGDRVMADHTDDTDYIWENYYFPEDKINQYSLTIFSREGELYRRQEEIHEQRAYDIQEVEDCLRKAGFMQMHCYTNRIGQTDVADCERIYFVAKG